MMGMVSIRYRILGLCVLALALIPFTAALADKGDLRPASRDQSVNIMLGKADMVDVGSDISDVMVADPSIVDVMAVRSNQLYVVGSAIGDTNLMVLDDEGNVVRKVNVHVQMDTDKLDDMIAQLYPHEKVKVDGLNDHLVLTGSVSTPAVSNSIANLVAQYASEVKKTPSASIDQTVTNMLTVAGEEQVMLKVKIIEVSRGALKDLGLETNLQNGSSGNWTGTVGTAAALGLSAPAQLGLFGLNFATGGFGPLQFLARALEQEGILNTLAEPNLSAISGEQAGFLAGGEIPIPTQLDRNGNLVYEFHPFGVSLNFRPHVMSSDRISLEMSTEVSSTSFDDNLQLNGIKIPSFNVRRAQTTVELPSGGTLMIAGLIQSNTLSGLTQIPGVKDVPVVGDLMKSDTFKRNESEVVVVITPYLIKPFAQDQTAGAQPLLPPTPPEGSSKLDAKDNKADMKAIPRLSMSDLQDNPETASLVASPAQKMAMAPAAGLSQEPMLPQTPLDKEPAKPEREKSALNRVFESNMKRTYGAQKIEKVTKDLGNFGYITE